MRVRFFSPLLLAAAAILFAEFATPVGATVVQAAERGAGGGRAFAGSGGREWFFGGGGARGPDIGGGGFRAQPSPRGYGWSDGGSRSFGKRYADEQRPNETRTLRDGDGAEPGPCRPGVAERPFDDAADIANVLPRRKFGNDSAPFAMDRHLRGDHIRTCRPGLRRGAGLFDDGSGRLIAGCLDTQNAHHS